MGIEENKAFVRKWAELEDQHELDAANDMYGQEMATENFTLEQNKAWEIMLFKAFPDMEWTIIDMIAEADKVAFILNVTGTHTGEPLLGIPATGKKVDLTNTRIVRIADNKFVEWKGTTDGTLLQQLGVKATMEEVVQAYIESQK